MLHLLSTLVYKLDGQGADREREKSRCNPQILAPQFREVSLVSGI